MMRQRITDRFVIELSAKLADREFQILETIDGLGFVTADQIERLYFHAFTALSRERVRQRTMRRLIDARTVITLMRRTGVAERWSGRRVYALDVAGERLMRQRQGISGASMAHRKSVPALQLFDHVLDISEIYVRLVEASRAHGFNVAEFLTEPASWWHEASREIIKPDAYARLIASNYADNWWIEVDRDTESVPTVARQLDTYVRFAQRGQPGPYGVIPRVLVTVPTNARCKALTATLSDFPPLATRLIAITPYNAAVGLLTTRLLSADQNIPAPKGDQ